MRPIFGILLELAALTVLLAVASMLANLWPLSILVLLLAQLLTTILIHCPAHYMVGRALGIRFRGIKLGRSTAFAALPSSLKRIGTFLVVFTLTVDRASKRTVAPSRLRAMYLAGVAGSVGGAFVFALVVSLTVNYPAAAATWLLALAYLASDVRFSPAAGDLMRARAAVTPGK